MILGIDQSLTSTGMVLLRETGQEELVTTIKTGKLRGVERLDFIIGSICSVIEPWKVTKIGMEDYAFSGNQGFSLGELGGVIKYVLFKKYGIKPVIIHNTKIKKWATGKGNANKNLVMLGTYKKYNVELKNDNEYDAYNIAKIVYWLNMDKNPQCVLTKQEKEVLDSIPMQ